MGLFEDLGRDLRVAARALTRDAGFTTVTVGTLALGVGSAAAVFGLFNQLILKPLPGVPYSSSAAYLTFDSPLAEDTPAIARTNRGMAIAEFDELRSQATLLDGIASHALLSGAASAGGGSPVQILGSWIYGDYFEALGAVPASGRLLTAEDNDPGSDPTVAVISERVAAILFPGDPDPAGSTFALDNKSLTVLGVAGGGFAGHERSAITYDVWLPLPAQVHLWDLPSDEDIRSDSPRHSRFLIRPSPGASFEAVDAQLRTILAAMAPTSSRSLELFEPRITPGLHVPPLAREETNTSLRTMAVAALLLLLAACASVANLLLIRHLNRGSSTAIRKALGASSTRVARLLTMESVLLGLAGATLGAGVAWVITRAFRGQSFPELPELSGFGVDWRVLSFLGAAAIGTTLLSGVGPAIVAGSKKLRVGMESRGGHSQGASLVRSSLSAAQVGLTLSILVGALLMGRTLSRLYSLETGLYLEGVSAVSLSFPGDLSLQPDQALDRLTRLTEAVTRIPGVEAVAAASVAPHESGSGLLLRPPNAPDAEFIQAVRWTVTDGFLEMIDWQVIEGDGSQVFERQADGIPRVLITPALGRELFGSSSAIGQSLMPGSELEYQVVGVLEDYRSHESPTEPRHAVVIDYAQGFPQGYGGSSLLFESERLTPDILSGVRSALESTFPGVPPEAPVPFEQRIYEIHTEPRALRNLFAIVSGFAIAVSAVGLYGLISYSVATRRREFGVRSALGAQASTLASLVLSQGGRIVAVGALLGIGLAYAISRLLEARLFGVEPLDPVSFALATALVIFVGIAATWIPAYRAARIDPAGALRVE